MDKIEKTYRKIKDVKAEDFLFLCEKYGVRVGARTREVIYNGVLYFNAGNVITVIKKKGSSNKPFECAQNLIERLNNKLGISTVWASISARVNGRTKI